MTGIFTCFVSFSRELLDKALGSASRLAGTNACQLFGIAAVISTHNPADGAGCGSGAQDQESDETDIDSEGPGGDDPCGKLDNDVNGAKSRNNRSTPSGNTRLIGCKSTYSLGQNQAIRVNLSRELAMRGVRNKICYNDTTDGGHAKREALLARAIADCSLKILGSGGF